MIYYDIMIYTYFSGAYLGCFVPLNLAVWGQLKKGYFQLQREKKKSEKHWLKLMKTKKKLTINPPFMKVLIQLHGNYGGCL